MASAKIIELDETNTCKICDNALAKYSCPKCNLIYCSLICYQSETHLDCSESFYKENVMNELSLDGNSSETKAKMLEILQRTHEDNRIPSPAYFEANSDDAGSAEFEDDDLDGLNAFSQFVDIEDLEEDLDSDDEEYINIAERLADVDLNDTETVWDQLTEDEKQDFVAFLKTEDVSKLIPSWSPWWFYNEHNVLVAEIDPKFKENCPKLVNINDFSTITVSLIFSKIPSNCVKFNLINILSAYAFGTRYFNGEHADFPNEVVATIATVSVALKKGQNFEDFETAVKSVEQECINCVWINTDSENLTLMRDDLEKILNGPNNEETNFYILCALSDLQNLLKESQKPKQNSTTNNGAFSKQFPNDQFPQVLYETKEKIKKYLKKIDYFLSYSKDVFQL